MAKNGCPLYTLRCSNDCERVGRVSVKDLSLRTHQGGVITLYDLLQRPSAFCPGVGDDVPALNEDLLDDAVAVRFQTTFLPIDLERSASTAKQPASAMEFCVEHMNRETKRDDAPRNLLLMASSQGLSMQQDGAGAKRLFLHARGRDSAEVGRYWLEAAPTKHRVGEQQRESAEATRETTQASQVADAASREASGRSGAAAAAARVAEDRAARDQSEALKIAAVAAKKEAAEAEAVANAARRSAEQAAEAATKQRELQTDAEDAAQLGKAVAGRFGIPAMGERCSAVLTAQVPLRLKPPTPSPRAILEKCGVPRHEAELVLSEARGELRSAVVLLTKRRAIATALQAHLAELAARGYVDRSEAQLALRKAAGHEEPVSKCNALVAATIEIIERERARAAELEQKAAQLVEMGYKKGDAI